MRPPLARLLPVACLSGLLALIPAFAPQARADVTVLTFEGLIDGESINDFYNGGYGSLGTVPGPNYGITFTTDSLALVSELSGGTGNFQNAPSGNTVAFFKTGVGDTMNVAAGFDTGFSFFYSAIVYSGIVEVYDDLNGTGNLLAILDLPVTPYDATLPTDYNRWFPVGISFTGTAKSVVFSGSANYIGFDNITLGSAIPHGIRPPGVPGDVPEPGTLVLFGAGTLGFAFAFRRRR